MLSQNTMKQIAAGVIIPVTIIAATAIALASDILLIVAMFLGFLAIIITYIAS
jgi:hypothetical protein